MRLRSMQAFLTGAVVAGLMAVAVLPASAQLIYPSGRDMMGTDRQYNDGRLFGDIQTLTDRNAHFQSLVGQRLDDSFWGGLPSEARLNARVGDLNAAIDRLCTDYNARSPGDVMRADVSRLMRVATPIDIDIAQRSYPYEVSAAWRNTRRALNDLTDFYGLPSLQEFASGGLPDRRFEFYMYG